MAERNGGYGLSLGVAINDGRILLERESQGGKTCRQPAICRLKKAITDMHDFICRVNRRTRGSGSEGKRDNLKGNVGSVGQHVNVVAVPLDETYVASRKVAAPLAARCPNLNKIGRIEVAEKHIAQRSYAGRRRLGNARGSIVNLRIEA